MGLTGQEGDLEAEEPKWAVASQQLAKLPQWQHWGHLPQPHLAEKRKPGAEQLQPWRAQPQGSRG